MCSVSLVSPSDGVVMPAQLAVGGGGLQQPALETDAVHGRDGPAAGARPHQPLRRLASEADAADVLRAQARAEARHLLRRRWRVLLEPFDQARRIRTYAASSYTMRWDKRVQHRAKTLCYNNINVMHENI